MRKNLLRYWLRRPLDLWRYGRWRYGKDSHESVYFFTFHKCASTLFSKYVLKNINGLRHLDYANQIYLGKGIDQVIFDNTGFAYGPIRLTTKDPHTREVLIEPTSEIDFIRDKKVLCLVRDPRDILVSAYYSYGFSHGFSPVKKRRERQEAIRKEIQSMTIDEYALKYAHEWLSAFQTVNKLVNECSKCVVLKYEDMIYSWDVFAKGLTQNLDIQPAILTKIYEESRPAEKEDKSSHRRSGKSGQFKAQFKEETIQSLNTTFEPILKTFQYNE